MDNETWMFSIVIGWNYYGYFNGILRYYCSGIIVSNGDTWTLDQGNMDLIRL